MYAYKTGGGVILFDYMFWLWVIFAALFIVAEIFTAGFFLAPFGIGAAVAAVLAFFQFNQGWQWFAFLVVSVILLILMRRISDKLTHEPPEKIGAERLVGKTGMVVEDLTPHSPIGKVRVEREEWRADGPDEQIIKKGTQIIVEKIEGTHLVVKPIENPEKTKEK